MLTSNAILADLRRKDRPGVRVIAATHGVSVNTVQRIAHAMIEGTRRTPRSTPRSICSAGLPT